MMLRQDLIRIPAMLAYVVQGPRQRLRQLSHHGLRTGLRVQGVGDDACNNAVLCQAGRQWGVVPLLACRDTLTLHQLRPAMKCWLIIESTIDIKIWQCLKSLNVLADNARYIARMAMGADVPSLADGSI